MSLTIVNPESLPRPSGFSHGMLVSGGRILFLAGQTAVNIRGDITTDDFVKQFELALQNIVEVVKKAGGTPKDIMTFTIFTTRMAEYKASLRLLTEGYKRRMGDHYPAMALVEVQELVNPKAKVEIQGIAVLEG